MKIFNALKFYRDFRIIYSDSGNKHNRPGWIQIHCPFCPGIKNFHLGYHINSGAYNCFRCGPKGQISVLKKLLSCTGTKAFQIQQEYMIEGSIHYNSTKTDKKNALQCVLPAGCIPLQPQHINYLKKRDFVAEDLALQWGLVGTGPVGPYKHRIIAPIYFNNILVSYQGRDITGKTDLRYKACPQDQEVIDHQNIVYGLDNVRGDSCVIVEGITDVWRLGYNAVCCFGTAFTTAQVNLIAERMETVYVLFDSDDPNAIKQSDKLAILLNARGLEIEILSLDYGDPAEMDQDDADNLMLELGLR